VAKQKLVQSKPKHCRAPADTQVPEWMTQKQVAKYLQCSVATIIRWKPPRHLVGMTPRYSRAEIDSWLFAREG